MHAGDDRHDYRQPKLAFSGGHEFASGQHEHAMLNAVVDADQFAAGGRYHPYGLRLQLSGRDSFVDPVLVARDRTKVALLSLAVDLLTI